MPASVKVDPSKRMFIIKMEGNVTAEDLKELARNLKNHPDFNPAYDRLVDLSAIDKMEISTEVVRQLAASSETTFDESSRRAIVASSDFMFGISRMYQTITNRLKQTRVFRTLEEARQWLEEE